MNSAAMTYDTFYASYNQIVILGVIVGNTSGVRLLRVARWVWENVPALFPEVADAILHAEPRAAAWDIAAMLSDIGGAWDTWSEAKRIAALPELAA